MPQFVKDVEEVRQRAIRKIEDGAVTEAYGLDKEHTISILNEALATEIVCVLRYMHHYFMATGVHGKGVSDEFKEHADAEREHADRIAERIQQLGGKPDFNPRTLLQRSASQYIEGETLADMIKEDLIAERMVVEVYTEMVRYFGDKDPTTRHMIEEILADEEEHASDLSDLLYIVDPHTGEDRGQDPGTDPLNIGRQSADNQKQRGKQNDNSQSDDNEGESEMAGSKRNQGTSESRDKNQRGSQGMSNRDAAQELQRGGLTGRGDKSLNTSSNRRNNNDKKQGADTRGNRDNAEMRPSLATRSARPASGRGNEVEPAHVPGTTGRPKRQRSNEIDDTSAGNVYAGEESGTNRAVRVTNGNRKRKKVA